MNTMPVQPSRNPQLSYTFPLESAPVSFPLPFKLARERTSDPTRMQN